MGWRHLLGREFPRVGDEGQRQGAPLTPAALNRQLVRAVRADARAARRRRTPLKGGPDGPDGPAVVAPRTAALLARLAPGERRRVAVLIQDERVGLLGRDREHEVGDLLAGMECEWTLPEVRRMFERTLQPGPSRQRVTWGAGAEQALRIPLGAARQLPPGDRAELTPYLRRVLVLALGHRGPAGRVEREHVELTPYLRGLLARVLGHQGEADRGARDRVAAAAYTLLDLSPDVEDVLPPDRGPYASGARCALGAAFYHPDVLALLALAARPVGVRPDYAWLGSAHELLARSRRAREALPVLLTAAGGRACCTAGKPVTEPLGERDAALLGALAWAACVSGQQRTLDALADALRQQGGAPPSDTPGWQGDFLRSGLAALSALAGQPEPGAHHRVLPKNRPAEAGWARRTLDELRLLPGLPDTGSFAYPIAGYTAVLTVRGDGHVQLRFRNAQGRLLSKVPSKVRHQPLAYAALRARAAELRARVTTHLGSLTERLAADPGLPADQWWTSHLDDPALTPLTRALIWQADTPRGPVVGMPVRRKRTTSWMLRDLGGGFHELTEATPVRLWNPRLADTAEVASWRGELTRRHITQPVPQLPPRS